MTISERMFEIMNKKSIKFKDLATYIDVYPSVISTWKKRGTNPPSEYIVQICEFLDVPIYFFLTGKTKDSYNTSISDEQINILTLYEKLNETNKIKLEGYIEGMVSSQETSQKEIKKIQTISYQKEKVNPLS